MSHDFFKYWMRDMALGIAVTAIALATGMSMPALMHTSSSETPKGAAAPGDRLADMACDQAPVRA